jgi:heptosyltransferase-2
MTAVIDTIADNNDVNILLIIFQSKSMMLKLFLTVASSQPRTKYILIYLVIWGFIILNQCNVIGNDGGATNMAKALGKPSLLSSPLDWKENLGYIRRRNPSPISTFEWLQTRLLSQKTEKELKCSTYKEFKPTLFKEKLKSFLLNILSN